MNRPALLVVLLALACTPTRDSNGREDDDPPATAADGGSGDGGVIEGEAGPVDAGAADAGAADAGAADAGTADAGAVDAGPTCPATADCRGLSCGTDPICGVECGPCGQLEQCTQGACVAVPQPAGGTFSGAVGGRTFTPRDSIVNGSTNRLVIELSSRDAVCAVIQAGHYTASATEVALVVNRSAALTPGTYALGGLTGFASFLVVDAACQSVADVTATSGTVTLTRVGIASGGTTDGSFDLLFGTDHVTGRFRATACPFPETRSGCQ